VDLDVRAHVLAVDVTGDVGLDEVLVEGAVELLGLGEAAAGHLDTPEQLVPGVLGGGLDAAEVPVRVVGLPVQPRVLVADVGDADLGLDDRVAGGVEGQVDRGRRTVGAVDDLRCGDR
jgi:hypothetical protein